MFWQKVGAPFKWVGHYLYERVEEVFKPCIDCCCTKKRLPEIVGIPVPYHHSSPIPGSPNTRRTELRRRVAQAECAVVLNELSLGPRQARSRLPNIEEQLDSNQSSQEAGPSRSYSANSPGEPSLPTPVQEPDPHNSSAPILNSQQQDSHPQAQDPGPSEALPANVTAEEPSSSMPMPGPNTRISSTTTLHSQEHSSHPQAQDPGPSEAFSAHVTEEPLSPMPTQEPNTRESSTTTLKSHEQDSHPQAQDSGPSEDSSKNVIEGQSLSQQASQEAGPSRSSSVYVTEQPSHSMPMQVSNTLNLSAANSNFQQTSSHLEAQNPGPSEPPSENAVGQQAGPSQLRQESGTPSVNITEETSGSTQAIPEPSTLDSSVIILNKQDSSSHLQVQGSGPTESPSSNVAEEQSGPPLPIQESGQIEVPSGIRSDQQDEALGETPTAAVPPRDDYVVQQEELLSVMSTSEPDFRQSPAVALTDASRIAEWIARHGILEDSDPATDPPSASNGQSSNDVIGEQSTLPQSANHGPSSFPCSDIHTTDCISTTPSNGQEIPATHGADGTEEQVPSPQTIRTVPPPNSITRMPLDTQRRHTAYLDDFPN